MKAGALQECDWEDEWQGCGLGDESELGDLEKVGVVKMDMYAY